MIEYPAKVFESIWFDEYKIDYTTNEIFVRGLCELGQKLGEEWSKLATEVQWHGWTVKEVGK